MEQLSHMQCAAIKVAFAHLIGDSELLARAITELHKTEGELQLEHVEQAIDYTAMRLELLPAAALLDRYRKTIATLLEIDRPKAKNALVQQKRKYESMATLVANTDDVLLLLRRKGIDVTLFVPTDVAFANFTSKRLSRNSNTMGVLTFDEIARDKNRTAALVRRHFSTLPLPDLKKIPIGEMRSIRLESADIFEIRRTAKDKWTVSNGFGLEAPITKTKRAVNGTIVVIGAVFQFGDSKTKRITENKPSRPAPQPQPQPQPQREIVYEQLPAIPEIVYGKLPPMPQPQRDQIYVDLSPETVYGVLPEKPELVYVDLSQFT